jgi:hypothetical protein
MATCATCGHDNPEGAWSCASCGQPMSTGNGGGGYDASEPVLDNDYYNAPTIYGTSSPTIPPLSTSGKSGEGPGLLKIVLIVGVLAVIAIVAVWFFFLKPGDDGSASLRLPPVAGVQTQSPCGLWNDISRQAADLRTTGARARRSAATTFDASGSYSDAQLAIAFGRPNGA